MSPSANPTMPQSQPTPKQPKKGYEMQVLEDLDDCFAVASLTITKETLQTMFRATKGGKPKDEKEALVHHLVYSVQGQEAPVEVWEAIETTPSPPERTRHYSKTPISMVKRSVLHFGNQRDRVYSLDDQDGGLSGPVGHLQIKDLAKRSGVSTAPVSMLEEGDEFDMLDEEIAELSRELTELEQEVEELKPQADKLAEVIKDMCRDLYEVYNLVKETDDSNATVMKVKDIKGAWMGYVDGYYKEAKELHELEAKRRRARHAADKANAAADKANAAAAAAAEVADEANAAAAAAEANAAPSSTTTDQTGTAEVTPEKHEMESGDLNE